MFKLVNQNIRLNEYDLQRGIFTGLEEDRESLERDRFYDQIWGLVAGLVDTHRAALNKTEPSKKVGDMRRDALGLWMRFMGCEAPSFFHGQASSRFEAKARAIYDESGAGDIDMFRRQLDEAYQAANEIFVKRLTKSQQKLVAVDKSFSSVVIGAFLLGKVHKKVWVETLQNVADYVASNRAQLDDNTYSKLSNSEIRHPVNANKITISPGSFTSWISLEASFGPKQYTRKRGKNLDRS